MIVGSSPACAEGGRSPLFPIKGVFLRPMPQFLSVDLTCKKLVGGTDVTEA